MSHFYVTAKGSAANIVHRTGTKKSGVAAHVHGWVSGVEVEGYVTDIGEDTFRIYRTGGSSLEGGRVYIGSVVGGRFLDEQQVLPVLPDHGFRVDLQPEEE